MKPLRLLVLITVIGTVALVALVAGVIVPLMASISSQRSEISMQRESIAELQAQQRNIASVTKEYDSLQTREGTINEQFLTESRSVDFFNAVDELVAKSGATNSQLRIDSPVRTKELQTLGIHLTFNASYRSTVLFLRGLANFKELVTVTNVSMSTGVSGAGNSVVIDAQVPWSQTI